MTFHVDPPSHVAHLVDVDPTAPEDDQVLAYDALLERWVPAGQTGGGATLSDAAPLGPVDPPQPGTSDEASRSDHQHPSQEVNGNGPSGVGGTIEIAGTEETVEHGQTSTPDTYELDLSPRNEDAAGSNWWLDNIGASTFQVNLASAPTAPALFAWSWTPRDPAEPPPVFTYDFATVDSEHGALFPDGVPLQLNIGGSSDGRTALTLDALDATEDLEVLACLLFTRDGSERRGVALRASGTSGDETGIAAYLNVNSGERIRVSEYSGGSWTVTATSGTTSVPLYRLMFLRVRVSATSVQVKHWPALEDEPVGWDLDEITAISGAGRNGLFAFDNVSGEQPLATYFAYDTDGGTAPMPDEVPGANQGATDFEGTAIDAAPAGWTDMPWAGTPNFWGSELSGLANQPAIANDFEWRGSYRYNEDLWGFSADGEALAFHPDGTLNRVLRWIGKDAPSRQAEILCLARTTKASGSIWLRVVLHNVTPLANDNDDGSLVNSSFYLLGTGAGGDPLELRYYDNSSSSTLLDDAPFTGTVGTWYWMRLRVDGSLLQGKIWDRGTSEPSGWQVVATDSRFDEGYLGFSPFADADQELRWIGVGHEGATVPVPTALA